MALKKLTTHAINIAHRRLLILGICLAVASLAALSFRLFGMESNVTTTINVEKLRKLSLSTGVSAATWSPDGRRVAVLSNFFRHVSIWEPVTGRIIEEFDLAAGPTACNELLFTSDGTGIISTYDAGDIINPAVASAAIWNIRSKQIVKYVGPVFPERDSRYNAAQIFALSSDGKKIALSPSSFVGAPIVIYTSPDWHSSYLVSVEDDIPISMDFSPDGNRLVVGTIGGKIFFVDLIARKIRVKRQIYVDHSGGTRAIAFSPDGRFIATGFGGGMAAKQPDGPSHEVTVSNPLQVLDAKTGILIEGASDVSQKIWKISWSSDGHLVATAENDRSAHIRVIGKLNETRAQIFLKGPVSDVQFAPKGNEVVVAGAKEVVAATIEIDSDNSK